MLLIVNESSCLRRLCAVMRNVCDVLIMALTPSNDLQVKMKPW